MNKEALDALANNIAAHANGENSSRKDHLPEFNDIGYGPKLNIRDSQDLAEHIKSTLLNEKTVGFVQPNGQEYYYNQDSNTVVCFDGSGKGTAFRPEDSEVYFIRKNLKQQRLAGVDLSWESGGIKRYHPELGQPFEVEKNRTIDKSEAKDQRTELRDALDQADREAAMKKSAAKQARIEHGADSVEAVKLARAAEKAKQAFESGKQEWHRRAVRDDGYEPFDPALAKKVEKFRTQESDAWRRHDGRKLSGEKEKTEREALQRRLDQQLQQSFSMDRGGLSFDR